jgi:hypothetical protein
MVKVKPDRTYYSKRSECVEQAKVRVVRQDNGEWDSKTGRWTADESSPVLGEFDRTGKFVAAIDLQPDAKFSAYADGMPAPISGEVRPAGGEVGNPLAQFRTNEYRLARVRLPHIPEASVMVRGYDLTFSCTEERICSPSLVRCGAVARPSLFATFLTSLPSGFMM